MINKRKLDKALEEVRKEALDEIAFNINRSAGVQPFINWQDFEKRSRNLATTTLLRGAVEVTIRKLRKRLTEGI